MEFVKSFRADERQAEREKRDGDQQDRIVKFVANYRFNQIINQLEDFAENSAQLTESNRVTVSYDAKKILNATEAIIAIG